MIDQNPLLDWFSSSLSTIRKYVAREPNSNAAALALVTFGAGVQVIGRYAPEYLRTLGASPIIIGLFGSVGIAVSTLIPYIDHHLGTERSNRSRLASVMRDRRTALLSAIATVGIVLWLLAPHFSGTLEWTVLLVGITLIGAWRPPWFERISVLGTHVAEYDRFISNREGNEAPCYVSALVGVALVAVFLTFVSEFRPGFQVVLALAAAIGLCVAVLWHSVPGGPKDRHAGGQMVPSLAKFRAEVLALPSDARRFLLGDTLVQFAAGMVSVFVVVTVTSRLNVSAVILGRQFRPAALFGAFVVVELVVGLMALGVVRRLSESVNSIWLLVVGSATTALFPLLLVSAPPNPLVVGSVFALFGLRMIGLPAQRALIDKFTIEGDEATTDGEVDVSDELLTNGAAAPYRLARDLVAIPSALVGGVLYAASPSLAFGLATAVGLLGVREYIAFTDLL